MSTSQNSPQQAEALRDAVVGLSGVAVPATATWSGSDILTWVSIVYVLLLIAGGLYRWYWLRRKMQHWEERLKHDPAAPPPDFRKTGPDNLDE